MELLAHLVLGIIVFYGILKLEEWYAQSPFLIEKAKRMADGQDWDQKEF